MKKTLTLHDEVTLNRVEDLQAVTDALVDMADSAGNFDITAEIEHLSAEVVDRNVEKPCPDQRVHHYNCTSGHGYDHERFLSLVLKVSSE